MLRLFRDKPLLRRLMGEGSSHSLDEAIHRARDAGIPVYAIGLGRQATSRVSNEGFDEAKLRRVATETGRKLFSAPLQPQLKQLYSALAMTMQKEYMLTYRSPRPTYDGTRRNIVVTVQREGSTGATTQGGYLERHLVNIRSDLRLFVAFLVPLLVLLAAPIALKQNAGAKKKEESVSLEGPPPSSASAPPVEIPQVSASAPLRVVVRFPVGLGIVSIGRSPDNAIILSDPTVVSHHARIEEEGGRYVVRDLSKGQTYVSYRGDPAQERPSGVNALRDGSSIRFGQVRTTFRQPTEASGTRTWLEVPFVLEPPVTIGRDPANHIVVNSPQIAPQQAEIRQEAGRWVLRDMGGGGWVRVSFSGNPAQARPLQGRNALKVGSVIYLGNVSIELQG